MKIAKIHKYYVVVHKKQEHNNNKTKKQTQRSMSGPEIEPGASGTAV